MKKVSLNKRLYMMFLISLVPIILYGFYKNGIKLYYGDIVGPLEMFTPLVILTSAVLGALFGVLLRESKLLKEDKVKALNRSREAVFEAIVLCAILPINTNALVIFLVTFVFSLLLDKFRVNKICLMYLAIYGINRIIGVNEFRNPYELSTALRYDGLDLFLGKGISGVFASSILFIVLATAFMSFNKMYKKEMVYASLITFLILGTVPFMIRGDYSSIFPFIFGYNFLFVLVFVAPSLYSSCYTVKGQILSGVMIGILTYAFSFFKPYLAAVLAVLVASILKNIIDRIFIIK